MALRRYFVIAAVLAQVATMGLAAGGSGGEVPAGSASKWYRGNLHSHTTESDGDSSPGVVARWYRDHGYDFLVLSDHNRLTTVSRLQEEIDKENRMSGTKPFLLVPGEEVSDEYKRESTRKHIHINAIGTTEVVGKQGGNSVKAVAQNCIDAINKLGGLPHVNHPNFGWSLTADHLYELRNVHHFEIYNGHPAVNNVGGGDSPGTEAMWDNLLIRGRLFYGLATDDSHHFKKMGRERANPGRGWVVVRAASLSAADIMAGLAAGHFYASTGVELDDAGTSRGVLRLKIHQHGDQKYRTQFIGRGGTVLEEDATTEPAYWIKPEDIYVRARVRSSNGDMAWTQPVMARDVATPQQEVLFGQH